MSRRVLPSEGLQAVVETPLLAHHDDHVDVSIRIYVEGTQYRAEVLAAGCMRRVPIEMSLHDLEMLNERLQRTTEDIAVENMGRKDLVPAKPEAQLRLLAKEGNDAFKQVFGNDYTRATVEELLGLRQGMSIQVVSEDFLLPWELIYPISLDEPLSYEHFWGMNHIISRAIVQSTRPGSLVSPVISVAHRPRLGLLIYGGSPSVTEKEPPFFEKLESDGKITLCRLRALDPEKKCEEFKEFKGFWDNALDLAHFACPISCEDDAPEASHILLSAEFPISLRDMELYFVDAEDRPLVIKSHPLIVMNAREASRTNPLCTSRFVKAFLRHGARGVVATECAVPDAFAAGFAEQLYRHLLAGKRLGDSLLATRRYFLEKYDNPSGLFYSMYAPSSIRLAQTGN